MKTNYRDFKIEVKREKSMTRYSLICYSVTRISDGFILVDGFTEGLDTVGEVIEDMRECINDYYVNPSMYEED